MSPAILRRAEAVFGIVADAPCADRAAMLDECCGQDEPLRALVEELLAEATDESRGPLDAAPAPAASPLADPTPTHIGPYRVLRVLGEGGMAVVYEAGQENPRRTVAVKVIRAAAASAEVQRRFLNEAHVLGQLRHPGIAQIFQAGVAEAAGHDSTIVRRPYFAMELIRGDTLTRYAQRATLTVPQRLELVARAAEAVQYAHQRGVIHRDLKPANILVDEPSGESIPSSPGLPDLPAQPKILDFGVARVVGRDLDAATMATRAGQVLGTLAYMSPEQLAGGADGVDTRADVYALGVILFELLAGRLPHDFDGVPLPEIARRARETPAPLLGSIDRRLSGEIEVIVARALDPDRDRRYQSARDLAGDLRRHLRGEAIEARRDSAVYVLRKTIHRHRAVAAAASLAVIGLVAFAVHAGVQAQQLQKISDDEREARLAAELAQRHADDSAAEARRQADTARRVSRFLGDILRLAGPTRDRPARSLTDMLDEASARLDRGVLAQTPEVEREVRDTLADTYSRLNLSDGGIRHRRWLVEWAASHEGEVSAAHAEALLTLAGALNEADQQVDAEAAARQSLRIYTEIRPQVSAEVCGAMDLLGNILMRMHRAAEALPFAEAAVEGYARLHGDDSRRAAFGYFNLGGVYRNLGRLDDMERLYLRAMPIFEATMPDSLAGIRLRYTYAKDCLVHRGRPAEAEPHLRVAVERATRVFGPTHPETHSAQRCLAVCLADLGRRDEAIAILHSAHEQAQRVGQWFVMGEPSTMTTLTRLLREAGRLDDARRVAVEALAKADHLRGPGSLYSLSAVESLIQTEIEAGRLDDARQRLDELLARADALPEPRDHRVGIILDRVRKALGDA